MKNQFEGAVVFVFSLVGGAFLSLSGAKAAGMKTAMSMAPLVFLVTGLIVGALTFLFCIFVNLSMSKALIISLTVSFLAGLAGHPLMEYHYR